MSGNGAPTKVLIADGHAMFAQALAEMLDVAEDETGCRGFEVVGLADGGERPRRPSQRVRTWW